jgi:transcriptional regulator with XRE-family HTH domain
VQALWVKAKDRLMAPPRSTRHKAIMKTFAQRLKSAREEAGFESAQGFAGVLGLEPHTYRKYERAQSEPTLETLVRICELLNVDANYLLPATSRKQSRKPGGESGSGARAA